MTDEGTARPRRALPPLDDDEFFEGPKPRRWRPRDEDPEDFFAYESASESALPGAHAVPPPPPVLPTVEAPAPLRGRRVSAEDLPDEWTSTLPRHSAVSPVHAIKSPDGPSFEIDDTLISDKGIDDTLISDTEIDDTLDSDTEIDDTLISDTEIDDTLISDTGTPQDPTRAKLREAQKGEPARPPWFWPVLAIAVVLALLLGAFLIERAVSGPTATTTKTAAALSSSLISAADIVGLSAGTTWAEATDLGPDVTAGNPLCLASSDSLTSKPDAVARRTLMAPDSSARILQQAEQYLSAADATNAFAQRSTQLGGCLGSQALITNGLAVSGLGDESVGVQVSAQESSTVTHDVLLVRTGSALMILDASQAKTAFDPAAVAKALASSLGRLCSGASGTCPTTPAVQVTVAPASTPAGWLTPGDLPRVTGGTGAWAGADVKPLASAGSECEGISLTAVPKATAQAQRGYSLANDPAASENFGVDEIIYTFASAADAKAFGDTLTANINDCPKRTIIAAVTTAGTLPAPASGVLYTIDQTVTSTTAARSRVAISTQGTRVVYLLANPTPTFDLSDAAWLGVLARATERTAQLP